MTKLKQPLVAHTGIGARAGAIDVDALGLKIIDAHQMRVEGRLKCGPMLIITEKTQDDFESIITKRMGAHGLAGQITQAELSLGHPRLDMN